MGGGALSPLALANKAESVVSVTSQCSFSSTIVHVGDKKPPESGTGVAEGGGARAPSAPPASVPPPAGCLLPPSGSWWREGGPVLAQGCRFLLSTRPPASAALSVPHPASCVLTVSSHTKSGV